MRERIGKIKRFALGPDVQSWKDVLRDRRRPWRTAIGAGIGAFVGGMPLLGVHTWITTAVLQPLSARRVAT